MGAQGALVGIGGCRSWRLSSGCSRSLSGRSGSSSGASEAISGIVGKASAFITADRVRTSGKERARVGRTFINIDALRTIT